MSEQLTLFPDERPGYRKIFRRWRKNPKTGAIEYPKRSKVFVMWVPVDQSGIKAA
ncbi:MAG: hypothetical protein J0M04_03815 [Verrucomicrobia bacterium]|nr:hypothetical protein [Verrucomicrobiota bacterium]